MAGMQLKFAITASYSLTHTGVSVLVAGYPSRLSSRLTFIRPAGRWFAEEALWTAMAAILSVLRLDYAKDLDGKRIEIKPEFTTGISV